MRTPSASKWQTVGYVVRGLLVALPVVLLAWATQSLGFWGHAQTADRATPSAFGDVVVRPGQAGEPFDGRVGNAPDGGFMAVDVTLVRLIREAYAHAWPTASDHIQLRDAQIVGGPAWIASERFTVQAHTPGRSGPPENALRLRTLLADRFKLHAHHELRELPVYTLTLARADGTFGPGLRKGVDCASQMAGRRSGGPPPGAALREKPAGRGDVLADRPGDRPPSTPGAQPCGANFGPGGMHLRGVSLQMFAGMALGNLVDRVIVDRTNLSGGYDIDFEFAPAAGSARADAASPPAAATANAGERPAIAAALQRQLGLTLDPQQARVDVLVVDRAEPLMRQ